MEGFSFSNFEVGYGTIRRKIIDTFPFQVEFNRLYFAKRLFVDEIDVRVWSHEDGE